MTDITQPILDAYLKAYNDIRDGVPGRHREAHVAGLQAAFAVAPQYETEITACYRPPTDNTRALLDGGLKRAFTYGAEWACSNPIHAEMDVQREFAARRFIDSFYEPHREPVSDDPIGADPDASGLGTVKHSHDYIVATIGQCFGRAEMPEEYSPNTLRKAGFLIGDLADRLMKALASPQPAVYGPIAAGVGRWIAPELTAAQMERMAFNLSAQFGPDFVEANKAFALAVYAEAYDMGRPAALTPPADPKTPDAGMGVRDALVKAERALKPFASRVYNDNGDISVTDTYRCGLDEFTGAYFAHRTCVSALAQPAPVGEDETRVREADEIVSALYRRFKEWNTRGFGPDDVTWCEVKADVLALIRAPQPPKAETPARVVEVAGQAIYDRQRKKLPDQESVNASRLWRSDDVPNIFWDGYCEDASAVLGVINLLSVAPDNIIHIQNLQSIKRRQDAAGICTKALDAAIAALSAAPAARPGDGFVLVPREPTREQLAVDISPEALLTLGDPNSSRVQQWRAALYRAMVSAAPAADGGRAKGWHDIVADEARMVAWVTDRFGAASQENSLERVNRLMEEVVEMHQAVYAKRRPVADGHVRANRIVAHVYSKTPGDPAQEMGGVMTCALALSANLGVPLDWAAKAEITRIEGLSKEHFDKRHQAKVDAGVAAQHKRP